MQNSPYAFSENPNSIGNLENILAEIEWSVANSDILLLSGWVESLKDRLTLDGTRRYTDYSSEEKKVLSAINILLNYAEVSEDLTIKQQEMKTLADYIVSYFKQFLPAALV